MVFIPMLGSYVMPDMVGGPTSQMLGNKIAQREFQRPQPAPRRALSALLALVVLLPLLLAPLPPPAPRPAEPRAPSRGTMKRSRLPTRHDCPPRLLLPADRGAGAQFVQRLALRRGVGGFTLKWYPRLFERATSGSRCATRLKVAAPPAWPRWCSAPGRLRPAPPPHPAAGGALTWSTSRSSCRTSSWA